MHSTCRKITSLSDVETIESIPLAQQGLAKNTYEVFQRSAQCHGNKNALRFLFAGTPDEKPFDYSYRDMLERITQAANLFRHAGIQKQDVVSILLPNVPQYHFALWGAQAAGIANPVNPMLSPEHIIEILNTAKSRALITLAPFPNLHLWQKIQRIAEQIPTLKAIFTIDLNQFIYGSKQPAATPQAFHPEIHVADFDLSLAEYNSQHIEHLLNLEPEDTACYFHTGGTTGAPKLAVQSHKNQVFSAWMVGQQLQWRENDVMHCGLPLFHVNAPLISGLAPFTTGGEVLMTSPQGFRSDTVISNFWKLVEKYKISFFMAVPTVYLALNKKWSGNTDTSSLKFAACGAAPMPTALISEFEARTNISILEGYGLTEGTVFSTVNPPYGSRLPGSIGIRIPYQAMKAVQLDDDGNRIRDCQPNEIGTLVIKGPNVFKGYLKESDNKNIWVDDDWLNTGDLGRQDEAGYFWLTGRSKDLIIRGGHNIDPRIIEETLNRHPSVAMAAAVGKPDKKMGETPAAYVTLHEGEKITERELLKFTSENISEHVATPTSLYIIDVMPLTAIGKIYKPALRLDITRRALLESLTTLKMNGIHLDVDVKPHTIHGQIASVTVPSRDYSPALTEKIRSLLEFFKIEFTIQPADELA
jgi:fatty-acyl-CoA synthase